jgi:hypothetical protein
MISISEKKGEKLNHSKTKEIINHSEVYRANKKNM